MNEREKLLADIELFLKAHNMPETTIGRNALGDTGFVHKLRRGRDVRLGTMEKIRAYMAGYGRNDGPLASKGRRSAA